MKQRSLHFNGSASGADSSRSCGARTRRGVTITEVLVVLLVVAVVVAALGPTARRLRTDSGQIASAANLQMLALAHAMYAADWNDRQVTWVPDDLGLVGGSLQAYAFQFGCPQPHLLGFAEIGSMYGWFLPCHVPFGAWNPGPYRASNFASATQALGAFRTPGSKAFAAYVDGRFYSTLLYAPNDTVTYERATPYFDVPAEFTILPAPNDFMVESSYAFSPAAMWHRDVFSKDPDTGLWWRDPSSFAISHQSPTVSQAMHPELKTRMIEHNWNFGQPGPVNPAFDGGQTPYFFSHGIDAAPLTLFFDGRVAELPNAHVAADDMTVLMATDGEVGLWTRDTPFGADGYVGAASFDGFVTGHHVYTAEGIRGRDILSVDPPRRGIAGGVAGGDQRPEPRHRNWRDQQGVGASLLLDPPLAGFMPQELPQ